MLAPVVIFVYARPEHTFKTIESLANNSLARETDVYIYSDAAKSEMAQIRVEKVREFIDTLAQLQLFRTISISKAEKNKGLAGSVISGVTEIINKYGKVIVVEDDLVSSPDFLEYMNEALDFYENDKRIWSISGYTFKIAIPKNYKKDVYLSYRGCSWGWGTWSDRWSKVDWEVKDYGEFKSDRVQRAKFNRGGRDMAGMLDAQIRGKIDSWAIRWCYTQSRLNMLTVYPIVSRIKNIGLDGTGTHSGVTCRYDADLSDGKPGCVFENPGVDHRIARAFRDHFGRELDFFMANMKSLIKRVLSMIGGLS